MSSHPVRFSARSRRWPLAIIAVFGLFAAYIGFMVLQAMRTSVDLVSPDYYQQELRHQQRLEAVARTAALPAPVQLRYHAATRRLLLVLPATLAKSAQGQLRFFRPSNQALDFSLPLRPDAGGLQPVSTARLAPGFWRVRLEMEAAGQTYYLEHPFTVARP